MTALRRLLFVSTCCAVFIVTESRKADFVNALVKNLRRNNDDYVDSTTGFINVSNPYLLQMSSSTKRSKNDTLNSPTIHHVKLNTIFYKSSPANVNKLFVDGKKPGEPKRRVFDSLELADISRLSDNDFLIVTTKTSPTHVPFKPDKSNAALQYIYPIRLRNATRTSSTSIFDSIINKTRSFNDVMKFRSNPDKDALWNEHKINKFKKFIQKNKQTFDQFMGHKIYGPPVQGSGALRQRAASAEHAPLAPHQLDMAPARGRLVHAMRLKGRLCQRSVLIPEGPKYNSRGKAYVGAYGHRRGRGYARTPRPTLLLPRCCNCCKKSLLGCE